ncbi:ABC transporter ATP-binding protein [Amycolatopsis sp. VS8301801F10]|uniref:ABC transporter ATP-binding protein n=1 Tax=Amycolatopsis sp. VS8301801F10 TaxID=2652442 RepID=UPI0038FC494E
MTEAFRLTGLVKQFKQVRAVDGMSLTVRRGEVVALLGPNGAGKSTTIDMLLGLTSPDEGSVEVFGGAPRAALDSGRLAAMVQNGFLLRDVTPAELVELHRSMFRNPLPAEEVYARAGIGEFARRRCGKLSGGQLQRVRYALALAGDPELLILDEPTAALDVDARREFWASMHEFTATGRTVLFATHYLAEAEDYADRVVLMRHGKVVADGAVDEVRANVSGRVIRAVVQDARTEALAALDGVARAVVQGDRTELDCTDSDLAIRALLAAFPRASSIEITSAGLEEAFLALTSDEPQGALR